ncbi:MAG TPA: hypothetical protein VJX67_18970 [Blastocatellia bacterium]|nr:hypothetical protein [Blastocatellia bacterium]
MNIGSEPPIDPRKGALSFHASARAPFAFSLADGVRGEALVVELDVRVGIDRQYVKARNTSRTPAEYLAARKEFLLIIYLLLVQLLPPILTDFPRFSGLELLLIQAWRNRASIHNDESPVTNPVPANIKKYLHRFRVSNKDLTGS